MYVDESYEPLRSKNEKLRNENEDLRLMLDIVKENRDLRSKFSSTLQNTDETIRCSGKKTSLLWQETLDEGQFNDSLTQAPHKMSSPLTLQSLAKSSPHETSPHPEFPDCSRSTHYGKDLSSKNLQRLLGEIAFQLDRRILSYIFQCQSRLYGFTVLNICDKITQVSTHPLTGEVDEGYRSQLTQRHRELTEMLQKHDYNMTTHPPLTEFIVNTYGVLKQRPDPHRAQQSGYNDPASLRKVVLNLTPTKMLRDMLRLLDCLCCMARQDGKPLLLW